ncbi:MAG TPA: enoyl-CoA hydratase/isomerase family protein [Acidimicrobiales bacterium]
MTVGIDLELDGPVGRIWLERPEKRNAMTAAMWAALPGLVDTAASDPAVRVLVVRGRGEHFCAGADIAELGTALAADTGAVAYRSLNATAEAALATAPIATVAAIDGSCIGGGVQLALACDLRVCTTRAAIGITAARLGISFPAPSLERLVATVGAAAARRLLMTAAVLDAAGAHHIGLVDAVVAPESLDDAVAATVAELLSVSSVTQLAAKEMVAEIAATGTVSDELARTWEQIAASHGDLDEGLRAFATRGVPAFGPRPSRDHR